jgi:hypothetical protein
MSASSTWLAESEPVWLLDIWNPDAENDESSSTKRWRDSGHDASRCSEMTLDDHQNIFPEWIERIIWVSENSGEYFPK